VLDCKPECVSGTAVHDWEFCDKFNNYSVLTAATHYYIS